MTKCLFLLLPLTLLIACGSDESSTSSEKSIFSEWTSLDETIYVDLRGMSLDTTSSGLWNTTAGFNCQCTTEITGTDKAGEISITNCSGANSSANDGACVTTFENSGQPYSFINRNGTLTVTYSDSTTESFQ